MHRLFTESGRRHAPPFPDPELVVRLRTLISAEQPDLVHAHNCLVNTFLPLKRHFRIPLVNIARHGLVCAKKHMMFDGQPCLGPECAGEHYGVVKRSITILAAMVRSLRRNVDRFLAVSNAVGRLNGLVIRGSCVSAQFVPYG
jgi:hypothetical protein